MRLRSTIAMGMLIWALPGCAWGTLAPPCQLPLVIDAPPDLRPLAERAAERWNASLGQRVFEFGAPSTISIRHGAAKIDPANQMHQLGFWVVSKHGACARGGVILIRAAPGMCEERLERILTHELGHALGLAHTDAIDLESIMLRWVPACGSSRLRGRLDPDLVMRARTLLQEAKHD